LDYTSLVLDFVLGDFVTLSCFQLTEFGIADQITLTGATGLVKICRSDDGILMLVCEDEGGAAINPAQPTPANFAVANTILGYVLDIGVQRMKILTQGDGYYFGSELRPPQSMRVVAQKDYNEGLFAWIRASIDTSYQSADRAIATNAIRTQHLLDTYNNARLFYPNFISESYLSLMRIIEALGGSAGRFDFALAAAQLSPALNQHIFDALAGVAAYPERLVKARALHAEAVAHITGNNGANAAAPLVALDDPGKVVFACCVSPYEYRSKFVHIGFPIPGVVRDSLGFEDDLGTAYLHPTVGMTWSRMFRPDGLREEDIIDVHELIEPAAFQKFKDVYFHLLPTWYFLKGYAREAILRKVTALGVPRA
jgi:hypothetical protein